MGHPGYEVTEGSLLFRGEDITAWTPDERAALSGFAHETMHNWRKLEVGEVVAAGL